MDSSWYRQVEEAWKGFVDGGSDCEEGFSRLYQLYVGTLVAYGKSLGFAVETCEDAVHDLFVRLYVKRDEMTIVRNINAYVFRSFKNNLLNAHRRSERQTSLDIDNLPFTTVVSVNDTYVSEEDEQEMVRTVQALLDELTPRQREAVYLRYMQNMDYDEIAVMLEMNAVSVRKLVYRAIIHLRSNSPLGYHVCLLTILTTRLLTWGVTAS